MSRDRATIRRSSVLAALALVSGGHGPTVPQPEGGREPCMGSLMSPPIGGTWTIAGRPVRASSSIPDASTGVEEYDFCGGGLGAPAHKDLIPYGGPERIGHNHSTDPRRPRLSGEGAPLAATRSLLLWGGVDAEGGPFLHPAFVIDAPPALPESDGPYRVRGRTASGDELFDLGFAMREVADGDGSSSFAFVVPAEPGWAGNLASITLSGPGGSTTLDGDTDLPMAILVDPSTGQVRAILRDLPQADAVAALAAQAGADSLHVLFSRGIPDAAAWDP